MASSSKCSEATSCSGLSSSSTRSSSSSSMEADQMVKVEIEAAEALADLAVWAVRDSGVQPSETKWRIKEKKGKRARKEVKTESPTSAFVDSLPSRADLDLRIQQDREVISHQPSEKECADHSHPEWETTKEMIKAEKEAESPKLSHPLFGCRRSRRNLTEAEKEERRIRRVLANRESARQTIRRRQALCEDLTKKASDLAWENENLKREKELALKEYQSLEITNKELKEQIAQAEPKMEEIPGNNRSSHVQTPPLPTNYPLFLFSRPPYASYFWPSVVQPSSPYHDLHTVAVVPPSVRSPSNNTVYVSDSSHLQENFTNVTGLRTPFCIVPCSWLLPHHDHRNQQSSQNSCPVGNIQEYIYSNSQNSAYTSKVVVRAESRHSSLPSAEEKNEANDLNEAPSLKDHTQNTVGVVVDRFEVDTRDQVRKVLSPVRLECIEPTSTVKQDKPSEDDRGLSSRTCDDLCHLAEKKHEPEIVSCKKTIDAMAATEARRRRKELTKLKNLHTRPCRMHF
ncbi:uncharacterized protein LOC111791175 isoform X1 [Cucurbita pepo subsp. pepo]|uniref:uncharacterized protein LOC111791175 isoform X1 n=1 Tax=Cucurbita pepo subsp. pepo TaxID=3664 RepID=UPI000C9D8F09|nr:uncharacterized protein LOC111791175 isoform X1 [Cucurbita pepo subsp. pepo]